MKPFWFAFLLGPLVTGCLVPLGYTSARAQGFVSDAASAQYLQLSLAYWQKGVEARDAAGSDQTTLATSLEALGQEFNRKIDLVTQGARDDEEIETGDDTGVPRRSLAGVALTEALGALGQGRSLSQISLAQQAEFQKVVEATSESRGLFLTQQSIWPDNTVRYRWLNASNPSPEHRAGVLAAMAAWTQLSGGRVSFQELEVNAWNDFQLTIGVLGCVLIQDAALEPGVNGRATVGYQCGSVFGYFKILKDMPVGEALQRTSLHELGHVLGLLHEHKRPDRDEWIDVASGGYSLGETDMATVDEFIQNLRWRSVQIHVGPWSVNLYFPVWWRERNAMLVGTFDIKSVMIYSGFLTRQTWTDPETGAVFPAGSVVPWNTDLSVTDIETIKALYD